MARVINSFALLLDEEVDDVTVLAERIAKKVDVTAPVAAVPAVADKKQLNQSKNLPGTGPGAAKFPTKPLPPSESVRGDRGERGRGRRGRGGGGYVRGGYGGNDREYYGNGNENEYTRRTYVDGANGYPTDDTPGVRGRGRGGYGRGRSRLSRGGYNRNEDGYGGNRNQVVEGGDEAGWEHIPQTHGKGYGHEAASNFDGERTYREGNRNFGGERRGYGGGGGGNRGYRRRNEGGDAAFGEHPNNDEVKENANEVDAIAEGTDIKTAVEGDAAPEELKDAEAEQKKPDEAADDKQPAKKDAEEKEEDENLMTLEEYEKLLAEKRKALVASKSEGRKVDADKEFEAMQVLEKKKEVIDDKPEAILKGKKKEVEKEEKPRKRLSINEFLKPNDGEEFVYNRGFGRNHGGRGSGGRGGGRGEFRGWERSDRGGDFRNSERGGGSGSGRFAGGGYNRGGGSRAPAIQDQSQFPVLGGGSQPVVGAA